MPLHAILGMEFQRLFFFLREQIFEQCQEVGKKKREYKYSFWLDSDPKWETCMEGKWEYEVTNNTDNIYNLYLYWRKSCSGTLDFMEGQLKVMK